MADNDAERLFALMWPEVVADSSGQPSVEYTGSQALPSAFAVTDFAAAAIATAASTVSRLIEVAGVSPRPAVTVDRGLASAWFGMSIRPEGWDMPATWDSVAGDYETGDGWIRLHTNAPLHRAAALEVLGAGEDRDAVGRAVRRWGAVDLQEEIVAAGGCAAAMLTVSGWKDHPQGQAVAVEPLVIAAATDTATGSSWRPRPERPLAGIRVLDMTRVLAGPVATRFLAGYGATVLRVDPPGWDEAIAPEVTLGKRCARIDAKDPAGRALLHSLVSQADVVVHGYRPGSLDQLGLSDAERDAIHPGLVDVSLDAYGWSGPWSGRRGFDSLVQMSSGIAERGREWAGSDKPTPLPVQALDQATGYLMAAAVVEGLAVRLTTGRGWKARCSLARVAQLLIDEASEPAERNVDPPGAALADIVEETSWGPARRVVPPARIAGAPMRWDLPASRLGSSAPHW